MGDLVLTGSPLELTLPDICARCGEPAKGRLYWERVFEVYDDGHGHMVEGARAPFCPPCLAQHEREVKRMSWLESFIQCFRSQNMISAVICGSIAVWMIFKFIPKLPGADWLGVAGTCAILAFFGLIAWASYGAARDATRHHTVPPLTAITKSFGFSRDTSELFEGLRYRYTPANERFAEALLAANRDRVWVPSGKTARKAAEKRVVLYVVLGVVAVIAVVWDWLH
jgi:hypothetical protein